MTQTIKDTVRSMWDKNYTLKSLIPAMAFMISMIFLHWNILGLFFFISIFTIFDVVGFSGLTAGRDKDDSPERISYRIIQLIMQVVSIAFVYSACGWQGALASLLAWWFVVCDRLFYTLQKYPVAPDMYADWLERWSVFMILKKYKINAYGKEFNTIALIGFIISCIITTL